MPYAMVVPHLNAILIALDDNNNLEELKNELQTHSPEVTILAMANNIVEARKMIDKHQPNTVFVETKLPYCSNHDMLKLLEPINYEIILINSCKECSFHLAHYIPFEHLEYITDSDKLKESVSKAQSNILHKMQMQVPVPVQTNKIKETFLKIKENGVEITLYFDNMLYLMASRSYTRIFMQDGSEHLICKSLKHFENTLPDDIFSRVDKSYIINKNHVAEYINEKNSYVIMKGGKKIPISQRKNIDFGSHYHTD